MTLKILIVDDEESIRSVMSLVLEDDGHTVTQASTAEEATLCCLRNAYDLVITDIRMRGMTGIELLEKINSITPDTRVVIMTSHASDGYVNRALKLGAFDFIEKPFRDLYEISYMAKRVSEDIENSSSGEASSAAGSSDKPAPVEPVAVKPAVTQKAPAAATLEEQPARTETKRKIIPIKSTTLQNTEKKLFKNQTLGLNDNEYFYRKLEDETKRAHKNHKNLVLLLLKIDNHSFLEKEHPEHLPIFKEKIAEVLTSLVKQNHPITQYHQEIYAVLLPEVSEISALIMAEKYKLHILRKGRELSGGSNNNLPVQISSSVTALENEWDADTFLTLSEEKLKSA